MIIGRDSSFYRPYIIEVNGKDYYVDNIVMYDSDGIMCQTGCGWFEKGISNDITEIELDTDAIKLRRKEKFDGEVFVTLHKKSYEKKSVATLYIPADMLNVHFVKYTYETDIWYVYKVFAGDNGICIRECMGSTDSNLSEIRREIEENDKNLDSYHLIYHTDDAISSCEELTRLAKMYKAERERLKNLSVEDALAEYKPFEKSED